MPRLLVHGAGSVLCRLYDFVQLVFTDLVLLNWRILLRLWITFNVSFVILFFPVEDFVHGYFCRIHLPIEIIAFFFIFKTGSLSFSHEDPQKPVIPSDFSS